MIRLVLSGLVWRVPLYLFVAAVLVRNVPMVKF